MSTNTYPALYAADTAPDAIEIYLKNGAEIVLTKTTSGDYVGRPVNRFGKPGSENVTITPCGRVLGLKALEHLNNGRFPSGGKHALQMELRAHITVAIRISEGVLEALDPNKLHEEMNKQFENRARAVGHLAGYPAMVNVDEDDPAVMAEDRLTYALLGIPEVAVQQAIEHGLCFDVSPEAIMVANKISYRFALPLEGVWDEEANSIAYSTNLPYGVCEVLRRQGITLKFSRINRATN